LEREEEITPEELGPTITKSEFKRALNELKERKKKKKKKKKILQSRQHTSRVTAST
jgi:hypothetical protein